MTRIGHKDSGFVFSRSVDSFYEGKRSLGINCVQMGFNKLTNRKRKLTEQNVIRMKEYVKNVVLLIVLKNISMGKLYI